ncbi:WxcM-like domain-containing protein [Sphingomonas sp.]|uniref:WxcM-like domain-containing protein n=1 Tax=Sphingomonas sp. TaxID=28214 RepID=UPI0035C79E99
MSLDDVFVHPQGICESATVGAGTRVWAFAHVLGRARIGRNCNICDHVFVENDVTVGDDVTIKCGVQLWDGTRVGNGVFIGPNATFTNDRFPRSKQYPDDFLPTTLEDGVSIGANATILPGLHIGTGAMVGAGAVVTRNVPPHAIVVGNPAVIVGYCQDQTAEQDGGGAAGTFDASGLPAEIGARRDLGVRGCWIERLPNFADMRGSLTALECGRGLPFVPERVFLVYGVPSDRVRGEHAHHRCRQFLVAASGGVSVVVDDGTARREVRLEDPSVGLHLAPMTWGTQYKFSRESVLLVAASDRYDDADYIRRYADFRALAAGGA